MSPYAEVVVALDRQTRELYSWANVQTQVKRTLIIVAVLMIASLAAVLRRDSAHSISAVSAATPSRAICSIAGVPAGVVPPLKPSPIAELLPSQMSKLEKAYFSMGCFWGSEGMLAACPGVMFTRAGFTGGTMPNPTYSAIGDHVETVEVLFDPDRVSYQQLLRHFWAHHNAHAKPVFRQYASAIFTTSTTQQDLAKKTKTEQDRQEPKPLLTAIKPLERFYPADPAQQKYYLSQDADLLARMPRYGDQRRETRLATKLNALVGHCGDRAELKSSLGELGLSDEVSETLLLRASWPAGADQVRQRSAADKVNRE